MFKNNEQLMKISVDDKKLHMEISIKDLKYIFETDSENFDESKIKRGKQKEFAEWVAKMLLEDSDQEIGDPYWALPFREIFVAALEGGTETKDGGLIKYGQD